MTEPTERYREWVAAFAEALGGMVKIAKDDLVTRFALVREEGRREEREKWIKSANPVASKAVLKEEGRREANHAWQDTNIPDWDAFAGIDLTTFTQGVKMKQLLTTTAIVGALALAGCVSPHGMQAVGVPDDAGYTYHYAQACVDSLCGSGLGSAALYGPPRSDGTRDIVPLGSASITSTGTVAGITLGVIAAGVADGLSHNPRL